MGRFVLSSRAEADLLSIGAYTLLTWGEAQTICYLNEPEPCFQQLADDPVSGRACDHVRPGLYRREVGKHVVFFRRRPSDTVVARVLHERMLPERHTCHDED